MPWEVIYQWTTDLDAAKWSDADVTATIGDGNRLRYTQSGAWGTVSEDFALVPGDDYRIRVDFLQKGGATGYFVPWVRVYGDEALAITLVPLTGIEANDNVWLPFTAATNMCRVFLAVESGTAGAWVEVADIVIEHWVEPAGETTDTKLAGITPPRMMVGTGQATRMYLGTDLVWQTTGLFSGDVVIDAPADGAQVSDLTNFNSTSLGDVERVVWQVTAEGTQNWVTIGEGEDIQYDVAQLAFGDYTVRASGYKGPILLGQDEVQVEVVEYQLTGSVTITAPAEGATVTGSTQFSCSFTGDIDNVVWDRSNDGGATWTQFGTTTSETEDTDLWAEGAWTVRCRGYAGATLVDTKTRNITVSHWQPTYVFRFSDSPSTSGWIPHRSSLSLQSGRLRITATSSNALAERNITVPTGRILRVRANLYGATSGNGIPDLQLGAGSSYDNIVFDGDPNTDYFFTATNSNLKVSLRTFGSVGQYSEWSELLVEDVTDGYPQGELTHVAQFQYYPRGWTARTEGAMDTAVITQGIGNPPGGCRAEINGGGSGSAVFEKELFRLMAGRRVLRVEDLSWQHYFATRSGTIPANHSETRVYLVVGNVEYLLATRSNIVQSSWLTQNIGTVEVNSTPQAEARSVRVRVRLYSNAGSSGAVETFFDNLNMKVVYGA